MPISNRRSHGVDQANTSYRIRPRSPHDSPLRRFPALYRREPNIDAGNQRIAQEILHGRCLLRSIPNRDLIGQDRDYCWDAASDRFRGAEVFRRDLVDSSYIARALDADDSPSIHAARRRVGGYFWLARLRLKIRSTPSSHRRTKANRRGLDKTEASGGNERNPSSRPRNHPVRFR